MILVLAISTGAFTLRNYIAEWVTSDFVEVTQVQPQWRRLSYDSHANLDNPDAKPYSNYVALTYKIYMGNTYDYAPWCEAESEISLDPSLAVVNNPNIFAPSKDVFGMIYAQQ